MLAFRDTAIAAAPVSVRFFRRSQRRAGDTRPISSRPRAPVTSATAFDCVKHPWNSPVLETANRRNVAFGTGFAVGA